MAFWHVGHAQRTRLGRDIPNPMSVHYDEPTRVRVFREQLQDTVTQTRLKILLKENDGQ